MEEWNPLGTPGRQNSRTDKTRGPAKVWRMAAAIKPLSCRLDQTSQGKMTVTRHATTQDSPINSALRQFEATEANLTKLERLWSQIEEKTPGGIVFGSNPTYEELVRFYRAILSGLPKIDGWKPDAVPMDLNAIAQNRLD